MAAFHFDFRCDLAKPIQPFALPSHAFEGDALSLTLSVLVYDSADPQQATPITGSVACSALRADGGTVITAGTAAAETETVAIPGGTAQATRCEVTLPQEAFAIEGRVVLSVRLSANGVATTVLCCWTTVHVTDSLTVIDPGSAIPNLAQLLAATTDANAAAAAANAAAEAIEGQIGAISEAHPNIFCLGTVSTNKGVTVSADADGSLITFSGESSNPPVTIPLFGQDDYSAAILPPGTYFVGEEQITGDKRLNIRIGDTTVTNQIVTIAEAKRCYLRFGTNHVDFTGCSARYWIIPLDAPTKFVPHSAASATDLVARAAAEALKDYIDEQIAGVMLAIANL